LERRKEFGKMEERVRLFYSDGNYHDSNIEKLGEMQIFLELKLITFDYNGRVICHPLVDESDQVSVVPSEYYGKAFLESDFLDEKKVKYAIKKIEFLVDEVLKEYVEKNNLNFYYDIINEKYIISNHEFTQRAKTKIQHVVNYGLEENIKSLIKTTDALTKKMIAL